MCDIESINKISSFLKVPAGKLSINNQEMVTRISKRGTVVGYIPVVNALYRESAIVDHPVDDPLHDVYTYQWLEYAISCVKNVPENSQNSRILLKELNGALRLSSYLIGNSLSIADVVMFYGLQPLMMSLTTAEKDTHLNLSRWYDHLQQNQALRQGGPLVNFRTIHLLGGCNLSH